MGKQIVYKAVSFVLVILSVFQISAFADNGEVSSFINSQNNWSYSTYMTDFKDNSIVFTPSTGNQTLGLKAKTFKNETLSFKYSQSSYEKNWLAFILRASKPDNAGYRTNGYWFLLSQDTIEIQRMPGGIRTMGFFEPLEPNKEYLIEISAVDTDDDGVLCTFKLDGQVIATWKDPVKISEEGYFTMLSSGAFNADMTIKSLSDEGKTVSDTTYETKRKIKDSVALFVNQPFAYVKCEKTPIDKESTEVKPLLINDKTMVPLRFITEALGAKVTYNEQTQIIGINLGGKYAEIKEGSKYCTVNDERMALDEPAVMIDNRIHVPLRAISEAFGKYVFWDDSGLIIISNDKTIFDSFGDKIYVNTLVDLFK